MADPRGGPQAWTGAAEPIACERPARAEGSLLQVRPAGVLVGGLSWEEGRLRVRLYNPGPKAAKATLSLPGFAAKEAWRTDLAGAPLRRLPIVKGAAQAVVPARGLATVALAP